MSAYSALVRGHMATGASQDAAQRLAHLIISGFREAQASLNGGSPMFSPKEKEPVAPGSQNIDVNHQYSDSSTTVLNTQGLSRHFGNFVFPYCLRIRIQRLTCQYRAASAVDQHLDSCARRFDPVNQY